MVNKRHSRDGTLEPKLVGIEQNLMLHLYLCDVFRWAHISTSTYNQRHFVSTLLL